MVGAVRVWKAIATTTPAPRRRGQGPQTARDALLRLIDALYAALFAINSVLTDYDPRYRRCLASTKTEQTGSVQTPD